MEKQRWEILDAAQLSVLIGVDEAYLRAVARKPQAHYQRFALRKRDGTLRHVFEPEPKLKAVQRWILDNILADLPVGAYAKAFRAGASIRDNARFHRRQPVVISLDIKDFFPSVSLRRIGQVFADAGCSPALALLLAKLCCLRTALPQGAPTSPALSNLVLGPFDATLAAYCRERNLRFTRYADDITVSGDAAAQKASLLQTVKRLLLEYGFRINRAKTKVLHRYQRQLVTGIVVNEKMQVPKAYRRRIRQEVHYIRRFGLASHVAREEIRHSRYLQHLLGKIQHVLMVNPGDEKMQAYRRYIGGLLQREARPQ